MLFLILNNSFKKKNFRIKTKNSTQQTTNKLKKSYFVIYSFLNNKFFLNQMISLNWKNKNLKFLKKKFNLISKFFKFPIIFYYYFQIVKKMKNFLQ